MSEVAIIFFCILQWSKPVSGFWLWKIKLNKKKRNIKIKVLKWTAEIIIYFCITYFFPCEKDKYFCALQSFHFYHVCISNFNWVMWWSLLMCRCCVFFLYSFHFTFHSFFPYGERLLEGVERTSKNTTIEREREYVQLLAQCFRSHSGIFRVGKNILYASVRVFIINFEGK